MKFTRKTFRVSLFFLLIYCALLFEIQAQQNNRIADSPDNCEITLSKLDHVASLFNNIKKEKSVLIIIAVGAKNVNSRYNSNRISDAVKYFTEGYKISNREIISGISPTSSDKLGYLEFYVNGELVNEIITRGKGRVCLDAIA